MKKSVLRKAAKILGITKKDLDWIKEAPGRAAAVARLNHVKGTAKYNFRGAVKTLHPDRTGDDPEKTELFRAVEGVYRRIQSTEIEALDMESLIIPLGGTNLCIVSDPMGNFELQSV